MKDYILELSFHPSLEDLVQTRLFLTRSTGNSSVEVNGTTTLSAYFDSAAARDDASNVLRDLEVELRTKESERIDWAERYRQSLQPLFIGNSFVLVPDASLIPRDAARHCLTIPQEQAFGTGSHESTALCIELLEELDLRGKSALDIGAGSGILALAMLRLGARKVIAFDHDVDAFRPLRENRNRNGVSTDRLPLYIGGIEALRGGRFDVITMNILAEIIVPLLPAVKEHVAGDLILSGILTTLRSEIVRQCARQGLGLAREREKGEWWAGSFRLSTS